MCALKFELRTGRENEATAISAPQKILAVGPYLLDRAIGDGINHPCVNSRTGERLFVQRMDLKAFVSMAYILLNECKGVQRTQDVYILDGKAYLFKGMSFGDLHNYLKQHKHLSEIQAVPLFRQIVEMVQDVHSKGIVLRDLKLKKFVFVDIHKTMLRLQSLEDSYQGTDQLTDRHGCPAYVCPEMLQPGPYSGRAADMWSLGVILYTLLVGHYPFFDTNPQDLFSKIQTGYYYIPEFISPLARSLIASLLCYDPFRRLSAETTLEHPWFNAPSERLIRPPDDQTVPSPDSKLY